MIDIKIIGSGSSGNCYLANINGTKIMLECGLPFKKIQKSLGYKTSDILTCLVTHEHSDHAKAVKELIKNGIDCYMTKGTAEVLGVTGHRIKHFVKQDETVYKSCIIGNVLIQPFKTIHDVREPVGFYIEDIHTKESLFFATDTAYLTYKIPDVDVLMVECNYVKFVIDSKVRDKKLNICLRNRIVKNHLSLETLLEALKVADLSKLKKIYVLHLSDGNSDEKTILQEIQKLTGKSIKIA